MNSLDFKTRTVISLVLSSLLLARNYALCLVQVATTCRSVFRYLWIIMRRGAFICQQGQISVTLCGHLETIRYGLNVSPPKFIC